MPASQLTNGCLIYIASLPNVSFHHTAAVMVKLFGCWESDILTLYKAVQIIQFLEMAS
ncbi:hypothetical protein T10_5589 [Trichinella papuae]|uniref:Uncharacterized protein n=1 Tax=Trichinella papuae TaxID=268474 RepID=A0A0V1LY86_9BILA|nr:hypothetical protein T10_5589 [Trichinella papuae]